MTPRGKLAGEIEADRRIDRAYRDGALQMLRVVSASLRTGERPDGAWGIVGWDAVEKFREQVECRATLSPSTNRTDK